MKRCMLRTVAGWIAATVLFSLPVCAKPAHSAASAILLDGGSGRVLYEYCADQKSLVASTTKIMTGLLIAEECALDAQIRIPAEAVGIEGSSLYLQEGEIWTVEALLYGMMLQSGNDAAAALALYSGGSLSAFADKMNQRAETLGLTGTHFMNPHGLDSEDHYSTARDLAVLAAAAMENPVFRQVVSTKTIAFGDRSFTNHNKLLWNYEGAIGVKTGYTRQAGRILVSAAERNGRRLIAVTICDRNDWKDHAELLDYGFSVYYQQMCVSEGQIMGQVPVISGAEAYADVYVDQSFSYPVTQGEMVSLQMNLPAFVYAPVLAGEPAGSVSVLLNDREIATIPLYWRFSVLEEA